MSNENIVIRQTKKFQNQTSTSVSSEIAPIQSIIVTLNHLAAFVAGGVNGYEI